MTLEGVSAVTLYVDETGVDTTSPLTLRVDSTHEAEITLKSGAGEEVVEVPAGESETTVTVCGRRTEKPKPEPNPGAAAAVR